jgi:hypothetical protein
MVTGMETGFLMPGGTVRRWAFDFHENDTPHEPQFLRTLSDDSRELMTFEAFLHLASGIHEGKVRQQEAWLHLYMFTPDHRLVPVTLDFREQDGIPQGWVRDSPKDSPIWSFDIL